METFKIFLKPLKTETEVLGAMFELDLICTFVMAGFLKILQIIGISSITSNSDI